MLVDAKAIFKVACQIESREARDAYLNQVFGDSSEVRDQVVTLLKVHDEDPGFLESPPSPVAATIDIPPISERPGTQIGRYKLVHEIGQGGMGVVYMAVQKEPVKRKVALKIIKPGMDTREVVGRFEAERQALALMDHQCIATVLDGGSTESGRPYFVMELVDGTPINEYADVCRYTTRQRLELFIQVCQAVQHAHQKGVIHRDIKPSNILVTNYDDKAVPKVIDFGIAKALHQQLSEQSVYTHATQMIGTPSYMSPEQAQRTGVDVDTRTDVYSLGVLLYELLTGTTPFDKERLKSSSLDEVKRIIREEEPPRPSTRLSTVDAALETVADKHSTDLRSLTQELTGELDWIVMKALEKDRTRRYESASDFGKDIQRHLDDDPVEACPPSTTYRLRKFARRHKAQLLTVASIAAVLLIATVVSSSLAAWAMKSKQKAEHETARAQAATRREKQARRQIRRHLYVADMNLVQQAWDEASIERAVELLERHLPTSGKEDLRTFEWHYFWRKCHPDVLTLKHDAPELRAAFSPDGKTVATACGDHTVRTWNTATGGLELTLEGHLDAVVSVAFSPDGTTLASGSRDCTVKLWNASTGELLSTLDDRRQDEGTKSTNGRRVLYAPDGKTFASSRRYDGATTLWSVPEYDEKLKINGDRSRSDSTAFSPDGKVLAIARLYAGIALHDAETGELKTRLETGCPQGVAFSSDGATLANASKDGCVRLWNWHTGELTRTLKGHTGEVIAVAFSPDGTMLASGGYDRRIRVRRVRDGKLITTYRGHSRWILHLAFSPDGSTMTSCSEDGTTRLWRVADDEKPQEVVAAHTKSVRSIDISPDGRLVASGSLSGVVKVWDAATGKLSQTLDHGEKVGAVSFSPQGNLLASATESHSVVKIWNLNTGELLATLQGRERDSDFYFRSVAFSPDGKTLASAGMHRSIELWNVSTGKELALLSGHTDAVHSVAFSKKGNVLASGSADHTVKLWDLTSGRLISTLEGHSEPVWSVTFSPDAKTLASGSSDCTVKLWDVETGKLKRTLKGHDDQVWTVTFSPDDTTLATGSVDHTIRLWDLVTGEMKSTLHGHTSVVTSLAFSPDGEILASGGWDSTIRFWRAPKAMVERGD